MSAETDLAAFLTGDAAVAALVGDRVVADRVEAGDALPFVVFTRQATEKFEGLDGTVFAERITFEVQVWADSRLAADAVADAIEAALQPAGHTVITRSGAYDGELDLSACVLAIDWWA